VRHAIGRPRHVSKEGSTDGSIVRTNHNLFLKHLQGHSIPILDLSPTFSDGFNAAVSRTLDLASSVSFQVSICKAWCY